MKKIIRTGIGVVLANGRIPALIMSGLVVIETTALIVMGRVSGPLWFDIAAAASLIAAILIGAELFLRFHKTPVAVN